MDMPTVPGTEPSPKRANKIPADASNGKAEATPADASNGVAEKTIDKLRDKLRGLGKRESQTRAVPPAEGTPEFKKLFRHGEIFFEETSSVAKYLLVPDEVEDPEQLLRLLLDQEFWGLPAPNLAIYATEAGGTHRAHLNPKEWKSRGEAPPAEFQQRCRPWDSDPERARRRHESKVEEIAYGVVRAATECGAWILPGDLCNMAGGSQGSIFKYACDDFAQRTGGLLERPIVLGGVSNLHFKENILFDEALKSCAEDGKDFKDKYEEARQRLDEIRSEKGAWKLAFPCEIDLREPSCELGEPVRERVLWPHEKDCYEGDNLISGAANACLNPRLSHVLFHNNSPAVNKLLGKDGILLSMVPSVCMVVDAKKSRIPGLFDEAFKGVQVVVLKNAGVRSTHLANAIEGSEDAGGIVVPDSSRNRTGGINNFTIFDCVQSSSDDVIARLTKALSNVTTEDLFELRFAQDEARRLLRAWQLYTKYGQASVSQKRMSVLLFALILVAGLLTQLAAVLFTSGNLEDDFPKVHSAVRLACGALPLVSTFLISVNSRFSPQVKSAFLDAAASRVKGEIYRYRARVGDYAVRSGSTQFARVLARGPGASSGAAAGTDSDRSSPKDKLERSDNEGNRAGGGVASRAQTVFTTSMARINTDLLGSDVRLDSLPEPSPAAIRSRMESLYPGQTTRLRRLKGNTGQEHASATGCFRKHGVVDNDYEEDLEDAVAGVDGAGALARLLGVRYKSEESEDDGLAAISADDYLLFRLQPLIKLYSRQAASLVFQYKYLYLLIFLSTAFSTLLTLVRLEMWIPLVVSASAGFSSTMEFGNVQARILSTNTALLALKNLVVWWEGLSMVQRRLPQNKELLVEAAEAAVETERGVVLSFFQKKRAAGEGGEDGAGEDGEEKKR